MVEKEEAEAGLGKARRRRMLVSVTNAQNPKWFPRSESRAASKNKRLD